MIDDKSGNLFGGDEPPKKPPPKRVDQLPQRVRRVDPPTSQVYAARVNVKLGQKRIDVLTAVWRTGKRGGTSLELSEQSGMRRENLSPHLRPLQRLGFVRENGTRDGGIVWIINDV